MGKTLNEYRDEAYANAEAKGFHKGDKCPKCNEEQDIDFGRRIALIHSELSEALTAHREGRWIKNVDVESNAELKGKLLEVNPVAMVNKSFYEQHLKGTVDEELADVLIRIFDLAGVYGIDLDWVVQAKMTYNKTREYLHGKKYG